MCKHALFNISSFPSLFSVALRGCDHPMHHEPSLVTKQPSFGFSNCSLAPVVSLSESIMRCTGLEYS